MQTYTASNFLTTEQISYVSYHPVAKVIDLLFAKGNTRIVGGAVRDLILGLQVQDFDIATSLLPEEVIKILQNNNIRCIKTGIEFGNVIAILDSCKIDINTLREDTLCLGRKAYVKFTKNFQIDASRRDFTINSLSYCIKTQYIFDYFDGISDIKNRNVVFIGDAHKRIQEDYLRIMRFFRFCSVYGADFDSNIVEICAKNKYLMIKNVSKDRIKHEIDLILEKDKNAYKVLQILFDKSILETIFSNLEINLNNFDNFCKAVDSASVENDISCKTRRLILYTYLFIDNNTNVLISALKLNKFSKHEINFIITLLNFYNNNTLSKNVCKENYYKSFLKLWYLSNDFTLVIGIVVFFSGLYNVDYEIMNECIFYFSTKPKKRMPINGYDIISRGIDKKKIKFIINELTDYWIKSEFSIKKQDLIKKLDSLSDET